MTFEAKAVTLVPSLLADALDSGNNVRPPTLHHYDDSRHMLMMSDGGDMNLKEAYESLSLKQVQDIGSRLGHWLATLHQHTSDTDIGPGGNQTAKAIYRYAYRGLSRSIKHWDLEDEYPLLASEVDTTYGSMLATCDENVCMGDFWPGNVVIGPAPSGPESLLSLTVVDWEMTRRGNGATDVGQFVAEAFLLDRFKSQDKGLAGTFLNAYMSHRWNERHVASYPSYMRRIGVHCGVHLGKLACEGLLRSVLDPSHTERY